MQALLWLYGILFLNTSAKNVNQMRDKSLICIVAVMLTCLITGCHQTSLPPSVTTNTSSVASYESNQKTSDKKNYPPLTDNGIKISTTNANPAQEVKIKAYVKGGKGPYQYTFTHKENNENWSEPKVQDSPDFSIKVPSHYCSYMIKMDVHDSLGNVLTKIFNINVSDTAHNDLKNKNIQLSSETVCPGTNHLFVSAEFEGGTAPYTYRYSYFDANGQEAVIVKDSDSDSSYLKLNTVPGAYTICVTATDSLGNTSQAVKKLNVTNCLPVKNICQYSDFPLPTGCEVTSLAICLRYYHFDVTKNQLADQYLPKGFFEFKDNIKYGPDLEYEFAGDPNFEESYGCYSHCIASAANNYFEDIGSPYRAKACNGKDFDELLDYLRQGKPVIVWTTMHLADSYISDTWLTNDGKEIEWLANEHCAVLVGYDENNNTVYVADPLTDSEIPEEYDKTLFETRYNEVKKHAAVIYPQ